MYAIKNMSKRIDNPKRFLAGFLTFAMVLALTPFIPMSVTVKAGTSVPITSGSGTSADPYIIYTANELAWLAEQVNDGDTPYDDKTYRLANDIDLSDFGAGWNGGEGWIPIGAWNGNPFRGVFDGNNMEITGLYIDTTSHVGYQYNAVGLFGAITGTIENTRLIDIDITCTGSSTNTGGVAGTVSKAGVGANVTNCYVSGTITGDTTTSVIGGIVGYVSGSGAYSFVKNSQSDVDVIGGGRVGGVAGSIATWGALENCYATGDISTSNPFYVGGVVGEVDGIGPSVKYCYATGTVSVGSGPIESDRYVGGIAGGSYDGAKNIINCVALNPAVAGSVTSVKRVVGYSSGGLKNNYALSTLLDIDSSDASWTNKGLDNPDGEDLTLSTSLTYDFWTDPANWDGSGWDESVWDISDGNWPTLKFTATPTDSPSPTPTDSLSPTPTDSPSPTPTDSPSPTPTDSPSPTPTDSPSPTPTYLLGTGLTFTVGANIDATKGKMVTVPISVSSNPGFSAVGFIVTYDPNVLEITSVATPVSAMPLNTEFALTTTPGTQWIHLINTTPADWSGNGVVVNVTFLVKSNAALGVSPISLNVTSTPDGLPGNANGDIMPDAVMNSGSVNVVDDKVYGDLNNNGSIDNTDLIFMLRYFAQPGTVIHAATADVNCDGEINSADLILLLRYFAQPGIILGPQK